MRKPTQKQQPTQVRRLLNEERKYNSEQRIRLSNATKETERQGITKWSSLPRDLYVECQTLKRAGYMVEFVVNEDGTLSTYAVKRRAA